MTSSSNQTYPQGMIVSTYDAVKVFRDSAKSLNLRDSEVEDILAGIVVIMLDDFQNFAGNLATLPDFTRMYPNPMLISSSNREALAVLTHQLGWKVYARLESLGAFSLQKQPGALGYFPYYLHQVLADDLVLSYCTDEPTG